MLFDRQQANCTFFGRVNIILSVVSYFDLLIYLVPNADLSGVHLPISLVSIYRSLWYPHWREMIHKQKRYNTLSIALVRTPVPSIMMRSFNHPTSSIFYFPQL
jgi:hypothetical protein